MKNATSTSVAADNAKVKEIVDRAWKVLRLLDLPRCDTRACEWRMNSDNRSMLFRHAWEGPNSPIGVDREGNLVLYGIRVVVVPDSVVRIELVVSI